MKTLLDFLKYTKNILTSEEYNAILLNANGLGFDNKLIVENSGFAVANAIRQKYKSKNICIICGKGYLGAVGLSTARHLLNYANLSVILLNNNEEIKNQVTLFNYERLSELINVKIINENNVSDLNNILKNNEVVISAIIGGGLRGRLSKFILKIVNLINESKKNIICIDVPTGINPDKGTTNIDYIKSNTVFCLYKIRQGIAKTKAIQNFVTIIDNKIPISAELLTGNGDIALATESRNININKYSNGSVLVIGGSEKYHGAPILSGSAAKNALAVLRVGSGYVTVIVPKSIEKIVKSISPDIIVNSMQFNDINKSMKFISEIKHNSIVIGPGSANEICFKLLASILKYEKAKENISIIDGDAIKLIKENTKLLNSNVILTPHEGEFFKLTNMNLKQKNFCEKIDVAIETAKTFKCIIVLKGDKTIITDGHQLKINNIPNPALAVMGSGDVLSGIISSYAAMHKNAFECAVAGVYAHSKISYNLYIEKGMHIIPDDIINALPKELKEFDRIIT